MRRLEGKLIIQCLYKLSTNNWKANKETTHTPLEAVSSSSFKSFGLSADNFKSGDKKTHTKEMTSRTKVCFIKNI